MDKRTAIHAVRCEWQRDPLPGYPRNLFGDGFYSDMEFAFYWNEEEVALVFRGTDSLLNVLMDALLPFLDRTREGAVSATTTFAWKDLFPSLLEGFDWIGPRCGRVLHVIGHSLGGAVAARVAFELVRNQVWPREEMKVWLFNSPRFCKEDWAYAYNQAVPATVRYFHWRDPVSHLPLLGMGFRHVGMSFGIGNRGIPLPRYHDLEALEAER